MTWLFSLLGLGSVGGIVAALVFIPGLREAAFLMLRGLPGWAWGALVGLALLGGVGWWHVHAVHAAFDQGKVAGIAASDAKWQGAFDQMQHASEIWRANYITISTALSDKLGARYAQDLRDNAAAADDLRLRGPGKAAACGRSIDHPGVPGSAAGAGPAPAAPDAPRPKLPADDGFAVVPWGWLVDRAREHDNLLAEVATRRAWYDQQKTLYDDQVAQLRTTFPEPAFGKDPNASAAPGPD